MKTNKKALLTVLCALLLVVASVMGTLAYLQDSESVTNTFTVGNVAIKLDETDIDGAEDARTEDGNKYKLYPGGEYVKDPMVTVLEGSDASYVRMIVTISNISAVKECFGQDFLPQYFCEGWDSTTWLTKGVKEDATANTAAYEFWYTTTVEAPDDGDDETTTNVALDPLFDKIVIAEDIDSEAFAKLADGLTITVEAHAIQADGFADADAAWAKFTK